MSRLEITPLAHAWIHDPVIWRRAEEQKAERAASEAAKAKLTRFRQEDRKHLKSGDLVLCETCNAYRPIEELSTATGETELIMCDPNTRRRHHRRNPCRSLYPPPKPPFFQLRAPLVPSQMLDEKGQEVPCERNPLSGEIFIYEYDRRGNRGGLLEYIRPAQED